MPCVFCLQALFRLRGPINLIGPGRLPVVLSVDEINRLLSGIDNTLYRLMASLLYGSGLRLMECIRLRVCDLDFDYKQIVVRDGKGKKDRVVPMPESLIASLKEQIAKVRSLHDEDLEAGYGEVHHDARRRPAGHPNISNTLS